MLDYYRRDDYALYKIKTKIGEQTIYSVGELIEITKSSLAGASAPETRKKLKDRLKQLHGLRKPNSMLFFPDKDMFPVSKREGHVYIVKELKNGKVTLNQITSSPPRVMKAKSLFNTKTKKPSYIKLDPVEKNVKGDPISYKDGYPTFGGFPKISQKDLIAYRQKLGSKKRK